MRSFVEFTHIDCFSLKRSPLTDICTVNAWHIGPEPRAGHAHEQVSPALWCAVSALRFLSQCCTSPHEHQELV